MTTEKAARGSCSYARAMGSGRTDSIIANADVFRMTVLSTLFALAMLAVPTAMALLKQIGAW